MTWAYLAFTFVVYMLFTYGIIKVQDDERKRWQSERRELLNRIQHPNIMPTRPVENTALPERQPDEWDKVGTVDLSEDGDGAA